MKESVLKFQIPDKKFHSEWTISVHVWPFFFMLQVTRVILDHSRCASCSCYPKEYLTQPIHKITFYTKVGTKIAGKCKNVKTMPNFRFLFLKWEPLLLTHLNVKKISQDPWKIAHICHNIEVIIA